MKRGIMRKPDLKIDGSNSNKQYENQRHLEFGPELPKTPPLENPKLYLATLGRAVHEVITGLRTVDQLAKALNEQVYESLRQRSAARARASVRERRQQVLQPTDVLNVRYQEPAENVIESVVLLTNRQRANAITIRLEALHGSWKATNIGFL
jgi:hypothetical protein